MAPTDCRLGGPLPRQLPNQPPTHPKTLPLREKSFQNYLISGIILSFPRLSQILG